MSNAASTQDKLNYIWQTLENVTYIIWEQDCPFSNPTVTTSQIEIFC